MVLISIIVKFLVKPVTYTEFNSSIYCDTYAKFVEFNNKKE